MGLPAWLVYGGKESLCNTLVMKHFDSWHELPGISDATDRASLLHANIVRRNIACFAAASKHEPRPQASIVINAVVAINSVACTTLSPRVASSPIQGNVHSCGPGQPTTDLARVLAQPSPA